MRLGPADDRVLHALADLQYLTCTQLLRLLYRGTALSSVQARLKRLTAAGYCARLLLPRSMPRGSSPYIYTLAQRGQRSVAAWGGEDLPRHRPVDERAHGLAFLAHRLACNDVVIAARLLCRDRPQFTLPEFVPERALRRQPSYVLLDGRRTAVIPDSWLRISHTRQGRTVSFPIVVELDRGSERQQAWRRKIRALLAWLDGPYTARFGTAYATIAVVAPDQPQRAATLRRWTAAVLAAQDRAQDGAFFLFTGMNPATVNTRAFFLAPRWQQPFADTDTALLALEVNGP